MFFLRTIVYVLVVTGPTIYKAITDSGNTEVVEAWNTNFYVPFAVSFFVFFALAYLTIFKHLTRTLERYDGASTYTLLDLFIMGYTSLRKEIEDKRHKIESKRSQTQARVFKDIGEALERYMKDIHLALLDESDKYSVDDFIVLVINGLITNVFSHNDARFTLREYNPEKDSMVARYSTSIGKLPGDIPLNKENMILFSMRQGRPVIFSNSKEHHFVTDKGTDSNDKHNGYRNYVSYCIFQDKGKPKLSVNLDVKTKAAEDKMFALVDSSIFTIICQTIAMKYRYTRKGTQQP